MRALVAETATVCHTEFRVALPSSKRHNTDMHRLVILLIATALTSARAWETRDTFEQYPAGSDGSPVWDTSSIGWETQGKQFVVTDPGKSFALRNDAPLGRRVSIEATLTVEKAVAGQWKVAGLTVAQSPGNYWQLALVEAPPENGGRHYVELAESLDNNWNAENVGADFAWQYNHPYRLRLELTPDGIRGTVRELDGTERARLAFRFDKRAVTFGRPGLSGAGFRAAFADVAARSDEEVRVAEKEIQFPPCTVAGDKSRLARPTGFFRVAERLGRWWLFTPQGEAFYAIGTDHVSYHAHWCEKLGYAPYHRNVARQFGSEAAWATNTLQRLKSWGFNTLPAGHSESLRHQGLPHIEFLSLGADFAGIEPMVPKENWTGFPNVFHPKFAAYCDKIARKRCAAQRDNPWLLGYFIDNELQWFGKSWNTTLHASALQLSTNNPARIAAEKTDAEEFTRLAAEKYFAVTSAAIRKYDPNHLVLGCRFAGNAPSNIWAVAGKYCDVVSLNIYPRLDLETGDTREIESFLRDVQGRTRKPMMITEWSFPALDAVDSTGKPLPSQHGAGMRVDTQEQKARCCELLQTLLFRLPFIVGSDYFMWGDEPALGISSTFPEDSNYGLVSESNQPYKELTGMFAALNPQVYQIHAGTKPEQPSPRQAAPAAFEPSGTVRVERDGDRLTVDNGVLRLVKDKPDGNAWNRVEFGGAVLGRFTPNIHQKMPQDFWNMPGRVTAVSVTNEPSRAVVEMTFEHPTYRAAYRFTVYAGQNWFLSQFLWLENTSAKPWRFVEYYHYALSKPGDVAGGSGVPNYYLPFASWQDKATGKQYGVVGLREKDFQMHFWLDEQGGQHPDARRVVDLDLAPGARYNEPQPPIIVFGAPANERPAALVQRLRAIRVSP